MREIADPVSGKAHPCHNGNCLPELQMQLMVVFTGKTMGKQIAYTLKPFVFKFKNQVMANKHAKKAMNVHDVLPAHMKRALAVVGDVATMATGDLLTTADMSEDDAVSMGGNLHKVRSSTES
eukprot:SAG22_NODE_632_length_8376_cov_4.201160_5_plen_122_part_00